MQVRYPHRRQPNLWLGAVAGAIGGAVGSWAIVRFNHALGRTEHGHPPRQHRRHSASPNDTDATISDEPATIQVASIVAGAVTDAQLDDREKQIGASLVHYAFGAAVGACYGAAAEYRQGATALAGLPFGTGVWIAADELGLPLVGLARKPTDYPAARHLAAFASHLVFGLATEAVRRQLRGPGRDAVPTTAWSPGSARTL
jgi:putative membrane protein